MKLLQQHLRQMASILTLLLLMAWNTSAQMTEATFRGQIKDELGGAVVRATVILVCADGTEKTNITNEEGMFVFSRLLGGRYTLRANALGFARYEMKDILISTSKSSFVNITLRVTLDEQKVDVKSEAQLNLDGGGGIVLRGTELDVLPDDPEELAAALKALAGPAAGLAGPEFYVDGFAGNLPPKHSIKEIRINPDPFSAENDRLGYGRVEIITKVGSTGFRGSMFGFLNDQALNSRNPYAPNRAPYQMSAYGFSLDSQIVPQRSSFNLSFERQGSHNNALISATTLDSALRIVPLNELVPTPQQAFFLSAGTSFQINKNNLLTGSYYYNHSNAKNRGIGNFSLESRAYNTASSLQTLRLSHSSILSPRVVNETGFFFMHREAQSRGDSSTPGINVLEAFIGGGSQISFSINRSDRWELQNYTIWSKGGHVIKVGGRLRRVSISDMSRSNFGGTYTFAGGVGPELDEHDHIVLNFEGKSKLIPITSIERYRRTLVFLRQGLSPQQLRVLGGGASQFSIAAGNPEISVRQIDFGGFVQDNWKLRPNFSLGLGLRFETQSNIGITPDFAPRVSFAWAPGTKASTQPKLVLRGGFGVFYDRISESLTIQASRFNGVNQQQFFVADNALLDTFPSVIPPETLVAFSAPSTAWQLASNLRPSYSLQSSMSVEAMLPLNFIITTTYINVHSSHVLRSRSLEQIVAQGSGRFFEYASDGRFNQNQLVVNLNRRLTKAATLFATYALSRALSDTDGSGTFAADQTDLKAEFGRSSADIRHRLTLSGSIRAPRGVSVSTIATVRSGLPFNITTGRDNNGDTIFSDRPALATDLSKPGIIVTKFGAFDPIPSPGQKRIPRNYGTGPGFFSINLGINKMFVLGRGNDSTKSRYRLTLSVYTVNLLNRTNRAVPVGNLGSPSFGRSLGIVGAGSSSGISSNRSIDVRLRFDF